MCITNNNSNIILYRLPKNFMASEHFTYYLYDHIIIRRLLVEFSRPLFSLDRS
jgi:hypothetical protein